MNNSTMNFTTTESTNFSTQTFGPVDFILTCIHGTNFLFGLPTHIYVVLLIIKGTGRGVTSEFFIFNLFICEIGNSLNGLVSMLAIYFSTILFLMNFLQGLKLTGRPLFQCLMCVERYLAVVHPVTFLKFKPLRYRVICSAVAWIITFGSCFYSLFIPQKNNFKTWVFSTQFLLFFFIQLFCLVAVLRALKQSGPGERGREGEEENHMKRRAFNLILITTVSMAFIFVPFTITGFSIVVMQQNHNAYWIPAMVCYVPAIFVQPVLYLHRTGKLSCLFSS